MTRQDVHFAGQRPGVRLSVIIPPDKRSDRAVMVLPGGGYTACAPEEGEPVANRFAQMGYTAFVLEYSTLHKSFDSATWTAPNENAYFPGPLLDLGLAVHAVKQYADMWQVNPAKLALCGLSAGAHLAACFAANKSIDLADITGIEPDLLRVAALVLGYPPTDYSLLIPDAGPLPAVSAMVFRSTFGPSRPHRQSWIGAVPPCTRTPMHRRPSCGTLGTTTMCPAKTR